MATAGVVLLGALVVGLVGIAAVVATRVRLEQPRSRQVWRVRHVVGTAFVVLAVVALGVPLVGATSFEVAYVVGDAGAAVDDPVPVGEAVERTVAVPLEGLPGATYLVRGRGVAVEDWRRGAGTMVVDIALPAADEPGTYRGTLRLTPYPAVLPRPVLAALAGRHPLVAMAAATAVLLVPPYLLVRLLVDGDRPVVRTARRHRGRRRPGGR